jgi:hypothetical protein
MTSANAKATIEISMPAATGERVMTESARIDAGYTGKKASRGFSPDA